MKNLKSFFGIAVMAAILTTSCDKVIEVTSIELNKITLTLEIGESQTLTPLVLPEKATDKSVIWTSDNASVASVEGGVVTAKASGTTNITATAGTQTATCVVTVRGVEINGVRWAICNVNSTGTFVSNPENYGAHYSWANAQKACPTGWRVPTRDEFSSLYNTALVSRKREILHNIEGMRFTDAENKGNSIFLPAAGYYDVVDEMINGEGFEGWYWSNASGYAYYFIYSTEYVNRNENTPIENGQSVRCVEIK